jgi:hypothetical protein
VPLAWFMGLPVVYKVVVVVTTAGVVMILVITTFGGPQKKEGPTKKQQEEEAIKGAKAPPPKDEDGPKVAAQAQGSGGEAGGCPPGYVPIKTAALIGAPTPLTAQADQYQYDQTEPPAAPKKSSDCKANTIKGTNKADTIKGTNKADLILGGAGDDKILAGLGIDKVIGGPGNDTILTVISPSNVQDTIRAGDGNDYVMITLSKSAFSKKKLVVRQRVDCGRDFDRYRAMFQFREDMWRDPGGKLRLIITHPDYCEHSLKIKPGPWRQSIEVKRQSIEVKPPKKPSRIKPKDRPEG